MRGEGGLGSVGDQQIEMQIPAIGDVTCTDDVIRLCV